MQHCPPDIDKTLYMLIYHCFNHSTWTDSPKNENTWWAEYVICCWLSHSKESDWLFLYPLPSHIPLDCGLAAPVRHVSRCSTEGVLFFFNCFFESFFDGWQSAQLVCTICSFSTGLCWPSFNFLLSHGCCIMHVACWDKSCGLEQHIVSPQSYFQGDWSRISLLETVSHPVLTHPVRTRACLIDKLRCQELLLCCFKTTLKCAPSIFIRPKTYHLAFIIFLALIITSHLHK